MFLPRTIVVGVRVNPAEVDQLEQVSAMCGLRRGTWARHVLLEAASNVLGEAQEQAITRVADEPQASKNKRGV